MAKKAKVWDGTAWQDIATAMPDLSNYSTTTQMNTAIGANAGLNLLSTQTLTSSASVSFTNFFSSSYTHYRIVFNLLSTSGTSNLLFRARVNTTDVTSGYYGTNFAIQHTGSTYVVNNQNASSFNIVELEEDNGSTNTNRHSILGIDLTTNGNLISLGGSGFSGRKLGAIVSGAVCLDATSPVTGFTLFTSTGTMKGTVALYGYRKA